VRVLTIPTPTTGRILIEDPAGSVSGLLVGCHGYGQSADTMLDELRRIPGSDAWRLVSVQALHRFYTRNDQAVVASWMTRQDRDAAIADNLSYLNRALDAAGADDESTIVFLGFSQGASMAARAAVRGSRRAAGLILLGGDIPPDTRDNPLQPFPPVLIGAGSRDTWYSGARVDADIVFLKGRGVRHDVVHFEGGHEFTDEFRDAAGKWLNAIVLTGARAAHPRH
jgi:predicted esterase